MSYDLEEYVGKDKFYIPREEFKNYTMEDLVMRLTSTGNFTVEVKKNENQEIRGVMINY